MNDFTASDYVKIGFGVLLLGVWVAMVLLKMEASPGATDLVAFCKLGLTGLAAHYLTTTTTPPPAGTTVITSTPSTGGTK